MFSRQDPRSEILLAVHENRASVCGSGYDGRPEWLLDGKEPFIGHLNHLHFDGFITFDKEAALPTPALLTPLGEAALTVLYGTLPAQSEKVQKSEVHIPLVEDSPDAGGHGDDGTADVGATNVGGPVCVEYLGFGPSIIDFANGEKFRSIVRKHGYQLVLEDQEVTGVEVLDIGQPLTQPSRLWLKDRATGASLAVLYDDSYDSWLESPGFIEILQLMDEHSKEHFQSRLFVYTPGYDSDDEDPSVEEGHRCYELDYDFTTGEYKE